MKNSRDTHSPERKGSLPEENSLGKGSPFLEVLDWESGKASVQPRALRGLARIVSNGLCHRCGSCVGVCPTGTLSVDAEGYPCIKSLSSCSDCSRCEKVCPGAEFNFAEQHRKRYGSDGDLADTQGFFTESFIGYSTVSGLREKSTSGGLVTGILLHLLETSRIDGAVVVSSDKDVLWKGKPIVARSAEEILASAKSKYAIAPTNSVFSEILKSPGKYALVGLPCQIHGFIKAAELDPRLRDRVVLTIGLYCHAAVEHEGYRIIWKSLGEKARSARRFIYRIGKHPGTPHIELADGSLYPVYFGSKTGYRPSSMEIINILYRLYSPARCLGCFDASSQFADISVGDPWMAPPDDYVDFRDGWSFALVRSERGSKICRELEESSKIVRKDVTRAEALACNRMMATEKRWRAFRVIKMLKKRGRPVPLYGTCDMEFPHPSGKQFIKTEINMLTHLFCYLPRLRAPLLSFFLSNGGYVLLWLNNRKRCVRIWLRDNAASLKRKYIRRA